MAWLTPEGHQRVSEAVAAAEARTAGEIVTVVADRSDGYSDIALVWSALIAFTALTIYAMFPEFYLGLVDRLTGSWGTEWTTSGILVLFGTFNAARFGSPLEFGHRYLPELAQAGTGMFVPSGVSEHVGWILRAPSVQHGVLTFPQAGGFAVYLTNPVLLIALAVIVIRALREKADDVDVLLLLPGSAHRDERVFEDPDDYRIGRDIGSKLMSFGSGAHFCLGAHLARLEIRLMFEELLRRLPDIEPDGPVERLRSDFLSGIKHMPVRFTPA